MRVLFITNTAPIPSWGGAMTFYRHFCERKDFQIAVVTSDKQVTKYEVPYEYILLDHNKALKRLFRTRFYKHAHTYKLLVGYNAIPDEVMELAVRFKPDAIYTVAGSWSHMAILARKVADKLKVPLIGSFNDWWFYGSVYHPSASRSIEGKFRQFYKDCDLALCTSEGMQKALGPHPNSVVLYPTGARIEALKPFTPRQDDQPFTVAFGGNLGDWYGKMLESLILNAKHTNIRFKIFGSNASWSADFDAFAKKAGIYMGQLPFDKLQEEMSKVDGLLLLMGFDKESAIVETTSFKTKFLDYLSFQKPIMLWGPSYCSAVQVAGEFGSAEICTSSDADRFLDTIIKVRDDVALQKRLVDNAYEMYQQRFNPDLLHEILLNKIKALVHTNINEQVPI